MPSSVTSWYWDSIHADMLQSEIKAHSHSKNCKNFFSTKVVACNKQWHTNVSLGFPGDENLDEFTSSLKTKSSIMLSYKTGQKITHTKQKVTGLYAGCSRGNLQRFGFYCLSQPYNDVRTQGCFGLSCSSSPASLHLALGKELILARLHWNFLLQVKPHLTKYARTKKHTIQKHIFINCCFFSQKKIMFKHRCLKDTFECLHQAPLAYDPQRKLSKNMCI